MKSSAGFSLVEALVVAAILFILLAISIPFVRDVRSLTRRSNCDQNLIRLAIATQSYADDFGHLPGGTFSFNANLNRPSSAEQDLSPEALDRDEVVRSLPEGYHHNWISSLLPYLDRQGLYQSIQYEYGVYSEANRLPREVDLAFLRCPAAAETQLPNTSSYVGLHAAESNPISPLDTGVFMLDRWIDESDIADGSAYTIIIGEKLSPPEYDLGWLSGTRSSLRNAGTPINSDIPIETYRDPLFVGGLASHHAGGASVAMGDASVKFLSESIDPSVYKSLVARSDQAEAVLEKPTDQ
ncbi:DUF1559 family PulG-like putative transporter [Neorhodopirellula pilleata]|uniref:DUF1559 domain-containing protein n=1 Tax=Neorhodopirellula pilleata TaxID=2714738 RepID=A0A5C6AWQ2_9BACT|nr:DUF1559 domain-containing protein [Neorhodopirellula pilleata]TWU03569.1 hypothetical protein Pla100_04960 [Neorhodopirellula pilleata]